MATNSIERWVRQNSCFIYVDKDQQPTILVNSFHKTIINHYKP